MIKLTRLHYWILSILVVASLTATQATYDRVVQPFKDTTRTAILKNNQPLLPSIPTLRLLSLNNEPLLADLLWLQTIQYFGSGSPYGNYPALGPMANHITSLDPQFAYPYEFGMIVLPFMGQADAAEKLGLRAQQAIPNNGLLSYYLGTVYHLNIKDYKKAAEYYRLASTQPGAPAASEELSKVAESQINTSREDREAAKIFWRTAIEKARNDDELDRAVRWLAHMEIVQSLEIAAQQFKNEQGRYPANLQELVDAKKISSIPASPIHRLLILQEDGRINFDQLESGY